MNNGTFLVIALVMVVISCSTMKQKGGFFYGLVGLLSAIGAIVFTIIG